MHRSLKSPRARARYLVLFNHEFPPSLPPSPSPRPHLTGRGDGEGGRENPPVEPELSTQSAVGAMVWLSRSVLPGTLQRIRLVKVTLRVSRVPLVSDRGWRLRGQCDPSGSVRSSIRVDPLIDHQVCIRLATTRSQNWGEANPSDPRPSLGRPRPIFGRSLQPCLLLIQLRNRLERLPFMRS
jgi:hypothetical protein